MIVRHRYRHAAALYYKARYYYMARRFYREGRYVGGLYVTTYFRAFGTATADHGITRGIARIVFQDGSFGLRS